MKKRGRRNFIKIGGGLFFTIPLLGLSKSHSPQNDHYRILLRTGWNVESYGDLACLPSFYRSIQRFIPDTEVILWPDKINGTLRTLLEKNFTMLNMVEGVINPNGEPSTDELKEAFGNADLFLYAPGAQSQIDWMDIGSDGIETKSLKYCREIELPYVVYGTGEIPRNQEKQAEFIHLLNGAKLAFVTDSGVEEDIKDLKLKIDNLEYGINPLFGFDLKNDSEARQYLNAADLSMQNFITIHFKKFSQAEDALMEKIKFLLENRIESSDHYILIVPDNLSEIDYMKNMYEELSEGARKRTVVYDGDFSPDLVSSIMEKSRITTGMSPYLLFSALQSDIPIFHLADSQEANDGQIFIDLGLKDYVMDIRKADQKELLKSLQDIDESYLNALLDINKSNKDMTSELEKSFGEIHRILTKIKPIRKEKKKKKN